MEHGLPCKRSPNLCGLSRRIPPRHLPRLSGAASHELLRPRFAQQRGAAAGLAPDEATISWGQRLPLPIESGQEEVQPVCLPLKWSTEKSEEKKAQPFYLPLKWPKPRQVNESPKRNSGSETLRGEASRGSSSELQKLPSAWIPLIKCVMDFFCRADFQSGLPTNSPSCSEFSTWRIRSGLEALLQGLALAHRAAACLAPCEGRAIAASARRSRLRRAAGQTADTDGGTSSRVWFLILKLKGSFFLNEAP